MNLLAIDTSTECASVALTSRGETRYEQQYAQRQHAQVLLPLVEKLLVEVGLNLSQLDGVVFGRGPGSFTGLRIACSIAKGLAYGHDLPLYPVSSLVAIAYEVFHEHPVFPEKTELLAMMDARMNQVYWAHFTNNNDVSDEFVTEVGHISYQSAHDLVIAGVGYKPYLTQLLQPVSSKLVADKQVFPSAKAMNYLVLEGKIKAVDAAEALPVYIRNQVTQVNFNG